MGSLFGSLSEEIYQVVSQTGRTIILFDREGNRTLEPKDARRLFAKPDKIMISVNEMGSDSDVTVYLGSNIEAKNIQGLINTLRSLTTRYNVILNLRKLNHPVVPKDFAQDVAVTESKMWGTTKSSYQKVGQCKIIVRHARNVSPDIFGSRSRNILNVFVETDQGERFKFPVNSIVGARAYARHLNNSGRPHDMISSKIISLSEELQQLSSVRKYIRTLLRQPVKEAEEVLEHIIPRMREIRNTLRGLSGPRKYHCVIEELDSNLVNTLVEGHDGDLVEELDRLKSVLNISDNHALVDALKPVAKIMLGEKMTNNFGSLFFRAVDLGSPEVANSLVEALKDEYGHEDTLWTTRGAKVAFLEESAFEDATAYLGLTETTHEIFEAEDKFVEYARNWYLNRYKQAGEPEVLNKEQEKGAEDLANGLKDIFQGKSPSNPAVTRIPGFTDESKRNAYVLGLYLEPNAGMTNDALFNYISNIADKLQNGISPTYIENIVVQHLVDMYDEKEERHTPAKAVGEALGGRTDNEERFAEPDYGEDISDEQIEEDINQLLNDFDMDRFIEEEYQSMIEDGVEISTKAVFERLVDWLEIEMDEKFGYKVDLKTDVKQYVYNDAIEALKSKGANISEVSLDENFVELLGQNVATDFGPGVVEERDGEFVKVRLQNGSVAKVNVSDVEVIDSVNEDESKLPEQVAFENWIGDFDIEKILSEAFRQEAVVEETPVEESETTEISEVSEVNEDDLDSLMVDLNNALDEDSEIVLGGDKNDDLDSLMADLNDALDEDSDIVLGGDKSDELINRVKSKTVGNPSEKFEEDANVFEDNDLENLSLSEENERKPRH